MESNNKRARVLVQTYLDVGQREFGATQCSKCSLVYTKGKEEAKHKRFCAGNGANRAIKWKLNSNSESDGEEIVMEVANEYTILVAPHAKCKRLIQCVDLALGYSRDGPGAGKSICLVLIIRQEAVGFLEADLAASQERISLLLSANSSTVARTLDDENSRDVVFGVKKIWVREDMRRQGWGTKLLDAARIKLGHPTSVPREQVAMSQPSTMGRAFANKYFANNSNNGEAEVLVYNL